MGHLKSLWCKPSNSLPETVFAHLKLNRRPERGLLMTLAGVGGSTGGCQDLGGVSKSPWPTSLLWRSRNWILSPYSLMIKLGKDSWYLSRTEVSSRLDWCTVSRAWGMRTEKQRKSSVGGPFLDGKATPETKWSCSDTEEDTEGRPPPQRKGVLYSYTYIELDNDFQQATISCILPTE